MFIIIPVKPLHQSKSRLAPVLSVEQRANLSRKLLWRTLQLARQAGQVVIISRDKSVRQLAKEAGAWALVESGTGLNRAIRQATEWVVAHKGQAALIIPGDLPWLTLADLTKMIALGRYAPSTVIAPCHRSTGTNGLLLRPPTLFHPAFGSDSFARHLQTARLAGVEATIYRTSTIAFDLDYPEDLERLGFTRLNEASDFCKANC